MADLLTMTAAGLYCAAGDFHIDPRRGVDRAVITHAHTDHARAGSRRYLTSPAGVRLLRQRVGSGARIDAAAYGRTVRINGVAVSLHPAGHILGSAQVRVEHRGEVWVVSGDYKTERDATCEPFEPVRCQTFITEATFAAPFYRWRPQAEIFSEINDWWRANAARGRVSVVGAYALGKAQRVLAGLDPAIGPIVVHPNVAKFLPAYREAGIRLPRVGRAVRPGSVFVTPSAGTGPGDEAVPAGFETAFASGWMLWRGAAKRYGVGRGFVLSDHADWNGLISAIEATGADQIIVTHGVGRDLLRWLRERGRNGRVLPEPGGRGAVRGQLELPLTGA